MNDSTRENCDLIRHDWRLDEVVALHNTPLMALLYRAQQVHRAHHEPDAVQLCSLLSIKTGACPEDCGYCPQSAHHSADLGPEGLMDVEAVLSTALQARDAGASRFCMGAAWREVKDGPAFDNVVEMVRGVSKLGMEACVTLGMLNADQAKRLADAGLKAYNHNLDTSREFYERIITTRRFEDRLDTLQHVRDAGVTVCSGGILGMGESIEDRCSMLCTLASLNPQPESVPINALVAVEGTPLADRPPVDALEMVRAIATTRILMPKAMVRLSAGRTNMSREAQVLCFMAGANSLFFGEKLLTTPNPDAADDRALLDAIGAHALEPEGVRV
jgi:biotin synthase